jgi:hypothetical protein
MTVEFATHPDANPFAPDPRDRTMNPTAFHSLLRNVAPALPEGLSRLPAGAPFSAEACFAAPVMLAITDQPDAALIAALAQATGGGVFLSLVRERTDFAGFPPSLLQRLPGSRIEFMMPLSLGEVGSQQGPWDPQAPARLLIITWAGDGPSATAEPARLALILGGAAADAGSRPLAEPSFPVLALAVEQTRDEALFRGSPGEGTLAEAVAQWSRPARFLVRPGLNRESLDGYMPVAALSDPPLVLYELRRPAAPQFERAADSALLMKGPSGRAAARITSQPEARNAFGPAPLLPPPASRPVRLENWNALNLDEGTRLLVQPDRTSLEGASLQQFLTAVQRAYAEARLMVGTELLSPGTAAPADMDVGSAGEMFQREPRRVAASAGRDAADPYASRLTYTGRVREQIASMGIMGRLGDLRDALQSRPELRELKFHAPSDALPQDPSVLIEIPWMPGVMLSIKARLSGKGVNLLVVPSDRRAATKAAFETLMTTGLRRPFTVQTGGIHGKYAHCVVPEPGARTGSRAVYFDYEQVDDIARVLADTVTRLQEQGRPDDTMRL